MESITSHIGVVVVAGGSGSRMGGNLPKQFMLLDGQPILARTINNFAEALPGAEIVVVLPADYIDFWQDYARRFDVAEHRTTACVRWRRTRLSGGSPERQSGKVRPFPSYSRSIRFAS